MARPSTIDRLPEEVRELIGRLREQGRTLDEILEHLQKLDILEDVISRSALHRHVQKMEALGRHLKVAREQAVAIVGQLGDRDDSKLARLNVELMHTIILKGLAAGDDDEPAALTPQEMMFVGRALAQLASAQKTDVDRTRQIREMAAAEARKAAATEAEEGAKEAGLSGDVVEAIKRRILGVAA